MILETGVNGAPEEGEPPVEGELPVEDGTLVGDGTAMDDGVVPDGEIPVEDDGPVGDKDAIDEGVVSGDDSAAEEPAPEVTYLAEAGTDDRTGVLDFGTRSMQEKLLQSSTQPFTIPGQEP